MLRSDAVTKRLLERSRRADAAGEEAKYANVLAGTAQFSLFVLEFLRNQRRRQVSSRPPGLVRIRAQAVSHHGCLALFTAPRYRDSSQ